MTPEVYFGEYGLTISKETWLDIQLCYVVLGYTIHLPYNFPSDQLLFFSDADAEGLCVLYFLFV